MKTNFFIFMLLIASFISYSQTEEFVCADLDSYNTNTFQNQSEFSYSTDPAFLYAMDPVVMNVYFWQVNDRHGVFGNDPSISDITETDVLKAVANLNIFYNEYNIFFKYRGLGKFNSPEVVYVQERDEFGYCHFKEDNGNYEVDETGFTRIENLCEMEQLLAFAEYNGFMPEENINIYIPYTTFASAGSSYKPKLIVAKPSLTTMGIIHEMGHALYLLHTHRNYIELDDPFDEDNNYTSLCEHVTRDEGDIDNYNAKSKGDLITDTAAVPDFKNEEYYVLLEQGLPTDNYQLWSYIVDCLYTGDGQDCQDNDYDIYPSDTKNVMAYTRQTCRESITIGQAIRIHEIVELWPSNYASRKAELYDLFEPYKGEYYVAGPLPEGYQEPLFQPGFKYQFMECEWGESTPADYGESFYYNSNNVISSFNNDETNYENITHPNHTAIHIKHGYGDFLDQPEKCYDNYNKAPSGGSITKFNDNVFNTNVTITAQDSTSINNENLIENLDPGLYNIKKTYNDGSTQETVIFKENN